MCGRGEGCDICLRPARVEIHWRDMAGSYCEICAARLLTEVEHAPVLMLAIGEPRDDEGGL
jgi:hypothetical protein